METSYDNIKAFIDGDGKLSGLPVKRLRRLIALHYMTKFFEAGRDYTHLEVNDILNSNSTINDCFMLRREMCDAGMMLRTPSGDRYWLNSEYALKEAQEN